MNAIVSKSNGFDIRVRLINSLPVFPMSTAAFALPDQSNDAFAAGGRRDRLLDETARLLLEQGVARTSMADIARKAGVSRAAIYYYFTDLQDLVFHSYARTCALMSAELAAASAAGGSALNIIERFACAMTGPRTSVLAPLAEVAFLHPEQQEAISSDYASLLEGVATILEAGIVAGSIRPCSPRIAGQGVLGLVSWAPLAWRWSTMAGLNHEDLVMVVNDLLRSGVAKRPYAQPANGPIRIAPMTFAASQAFDAPSMAAARQEALMVAASSLFNQKGIDATSLDEIAQRLNVTKKVISHYFGDKAALVAECYRRSFNMFLEIAERANAFEGTAAQAAWAAAYALAEASLSDDIAPLAPLAGIGALPKIVQDELEGSAIKLMNLYMRLHERGKREGSIATLNSHAAIVMHPGYFEWLPKWLKLFSAKERVVMAQEISDLYILGLAV